MRVDSMPDSALPAAKVPGDFFIYVVDDEETLLELADFILGMEGYRYKTFESPKEAVLTFQQAVDRPDLIITDFVMNGMDGLELIARCKHIAPKVKTLLVSGTVQEEVVYRAEVKVDHFLRKPYLAQEFTSAVRSVLGLEEKLEP